MWICGPVMGKEARKGIGVDLGGTDRRQPAEEVRWVVAVTTQRGIDRAWRGGESTMTPGSGAQS